MERYSCKQSVSIPVGVRKVQAVLPVETIRREIDEEEHFGDCVGFGLRLFLSGCVESRPAESVRKPAQNDKRIEGLESRLKRLEKLVGKSDYDYPSLRHDVRKDLEERLKKLEKVVALTLLPREPIRCVTEVRMCRAGADAARFFQSCK